MAAITAISGMTVMVVTAATMAVAGVASINDRDAWLSSRATKRGQPLTGDNFNQGLTLYLSQNPAFLPLPPH
jgi:hypothetical protein